MGTADVVEARALAADDRAWKREVLVSGWGGTAVARNGELVDAADLDGFVAVVGEDRLGLLTFRQQHPDFEIVTIQSLREGIGIGRALMDAARGRAQELGARRLWLRTTNNNFRAFAFYQRWGMDLAELHPHAVEPSRLVKPSIPLVDARGTPIRHELEFELRLRI